MRPFSVAAALALAASASLAQAQPVVLPSPAFRGGNVGWDVVLSADETYWQADVRLPNAAQRARERLKAAEVRDGKFHLGGSGGVDAKLAAIVIEPVPPGGECRQSDGILGGDYGRYTYRITLILATASLRESRDVAKSATLHGCGNFTLD